MKLAGNTKPLSYLRSQPSKILRTVQGTKGPLLITHRGEVRMVLQDIESFEAMNESLSLLRILALGENDRRAGRAKPLKKAFADLRRRIRRHA
jgi:prevent-host-death family protein